VCNADTGIANGDSNGHLVVGPCLGLTAELDLPGIGELDGIVAEIEHKLS
jgi:hypothetical protein